MAKSAQGRARSPGRGSLTRHLEGWQPGAVAVLLAGSAALLAVPRAVPPMELPVPYADPRALAQAHADDDARARAAEREPLDPDVRALGSLVRAFGRADALGDEDALASVRVQISAAAPRARARGDEPLLELRAYQLRAFLGAARRWATTGEDEQELIELGGPFARMVRRNGWCDGEVPCALKLDDPALRASWKRRWSEITGLRGGALEPTLDEQRALYRFLLAHPAPSAALPSAPEGGEQPPLSSAEAAFLLRKLDELAAFDPAYPQQLARGIVLYRQGEYRRAAEAFSGHLEAAPDGPYTLRAQNYLRSALERSASDLL